MSKKYFGTDGIRGRVNQEKINGEMFFKFGLAVGTHFKNLPNIMGVLNLTPDSYSDGGKYNKNNLRYNHALQLFKSGSNIIDVGGESKRPGSKEIKSKN